MVLSKIRKIARVLMAVYAVAIFAIGTAAVVDNFSTPAHAQQLTVQQSTQTNNNGPFQKVIQLLVGIFASVRNLVYIAASFVIIWQVYSWISSPKDFDWKNLVVIVICLVLIASVGILIESVTGQASGTNSFVPGSTIQVN